MPAAPRAVIAWRSEAAHLLAGQGFSRNLRLLKAAEFEAVLKHRCAVRSRYFQVMGRPNDLGHARLGMIVSKRQFARSVDRNRLRRQIREVFRLEVANLPPLDLVVRPHGPRADYPLLTDLREAFSMAAKKCGVS